MTTHKELRLQQLSGLIDRAEQDIADAEMDIEIVRQMGQDTTEMSMGITNAKLQLQRLKDAKDAIVLR